MDQRDYDTYYKGIERSVEAVAFHLMGLKESDDPEILKMHLEAITTIDKIIPIKTLFLNDPSLSGIVEKLKKLDLWGEIK